MENGDTPVTETGDTFGNKRNRKPLQSAGPKRNGKPLQI
jgi:hypothetical protein